MFNINTPMMNFVKQSELNLQHIKKDILEGKNGFIKKIKEN